MLNEGVRHTFTAVHRDIGFAAAIPINLAYSAKSGFYLDKRVIIHVIVRPIAPSELEAEDLRVPARLMMPEIDFSETFNAESEFLQGDLLWTPSNAKLPPFHLHSQFLTTIGAFSSDSKTFIDLLDSLLTTSVDPALIQVFIESLYWKPLPVVLEKETVSRTMDFGTFIHFALIVLPHTHPLLGEFVVLFKWSFNTLSSYDKVRVLQLEVERPDPLFNQQNFVMEHIIYMLRKESEEKSLEVLTALVSSLKDALADDSSCYSARYDVALSKLLPNYKMPRSMKMKWYHCEPTESRSATGARLGHSCFGLVWQQLLPRRHLLNGTHVALSPRYLKWIDEEGACGASKVEKNETENQSSAPSGGPSFASSSADSHPSLTSNHNSGDSNPERDIEERKRLNEFVFRISGYPGKFIRARGYYCYSQWTWFKKMMDSKLTEWRERQAELIEGFPPNVLLAILYCLEWVPCDYESFLSFEEMDWVIENAEQYGLRSSLDQPTNPCFENLLSVCDRVVYPGLSPQYLSRTLNSTHNHGRYDLLPKYTEYVATHWTKLYHKSPKLNLKDIHLEVASALFNSVVDHVEKTKKKEEDEKAEKSKQANKDGEQNKEE